MPITAQGMEEMETEGVYKCTRDSDSRVVPFDHLGLHAHSSTWIVFNTFLLRIPDYLGVNCFRLQIAFRFT